MRVVTKSIGKKMEEKMDIVNESVDDMAELISSSIYKMVEQLPIDMRAELIKKVGSNICRKCIKDINETIDE